MGGRPYAFCPFRVTFNRHPSGTSMRDAATSIASPAGWPQISSSAPMSPWLGLTYQLDGALQARATLLRSSPRSMQHLRIRGGEMGRGGRGRGEGEKEVIPNRADLSKARLGHREPSPTLDVST